MLNQLKVAQVASILKINQSEVVSRLKQAILSTTIDRFDYFIKNIKNPDKVSESDLLEASSYAKKFSDHRWIIETARKYPYLSDSPVVIALIIINEKAALVKADSVRDCLWVFDNTFDVHTKLLALEKAYAKASLFNLTELIEIFNRASDDLKCKVILKIYGNNDY